MRRACYQNSITTEVEEGSDVNPAVNLAVDFAFHVSAAAVGGHANNDRTKMVTNFSKRYQY
jgi:hypothetical protein